jgi:hypothetical protein
MRSAIKRAALALLPAMLDCGAALAQPLPRPLADPITTREGFLAATIAVMMLCGLASFLLLGRISARTHVALAMLGMLAGAFALLVLFGGFLYENPGAAVLALLLLVGLFKLMSLFEASRKPDRTQSKD